MPREQEEFQQAVRRILEIVMFENWLRFYFIVEDAGAAKSENDAPAPEGILRIELPERSLQKIKDLYPDMYPLAVSMNNKQVDFDISRRSVLTHILDNVDGRQIARGLAQTVFSSSAFQKDMQLFHAWVQIHEEQLDKGFLDFGTWRKLFFEWEKGPGAKSLMQNASDVQKDNTDK